MSVCVSGDASGQGEEEKSENLHLTTGLHLSVCLSVYLPTCLYGMVFSCSALTQWWLLKAKDFILKREGKVEKNQNKHVK